MVDIAKCNNKNCAIRYSCFRFLATPSEYQSYLLIDKEVETLEACASYWPCKTQEELNKLNRAWRD